MPTVGRGCDGGCRRLVLVVAADRRSWMLVAAARHVNATLYQEGETMVRVNAIAVGDDGWGGGARPGGGMMAPIGGHSCVFLRWRQARGAALRGLHRMWGSVSAVDGGGVIGRGNPMGTRTVVGSLAWVSYLLRTNRSTVFAARRVGMCTSWELEDSKGSSNEDAHTCPGVVPITATKESCRDSSLACAKRG